MSQVNIKSQVNIMSQVNIKSQVNIILRSHDTLNRARHSTVRYGTVKIAV